MSWYPEPDTPLPNDVLEGEKVEVSPSVVRFSVNHRSLTRYSSSYTISCTAEVQPPYHGPSHLAAIIPLIAEAKRSLYDELTSTMPNFSLDHVNYMTLRVYQVPIFPNAMPLVLRMRTVDEDLDPHIAIRLAGFEQSGKPYSIFNVFNVFLDVVF